MRHGAWRGGGVSRATAGEALARRLLHLYFDADSEAAVCFRPLLGPGQPLIRRPRHAGSLLLTYLSSRWGANLGGSLIGRRADSDFLGYGINHAAGYARVDLGGWYAFTSRITAYVNLENALEKPIRKSWAIRHWGQISAPDCDSESAESDCPLVWGGRPRPPVSR